MAKKLASARRRSRHLRRPAVDAKPAEKAKKLASARRRSRHLRRPAVDAKPAEKAKEVTRPGQASLLTPAAHRGRQAKRRRSSERVPELSSGSPRTRGQPGVSVSVRSGRGSRGPPGRSLLRTLTGNREDHIRTDRAPGPTTSAHVARARPISATPGSRNGKLPARYLGPSPGGVHT